MRNCYKKSAFRKSVFRYVRLLGEHFYPQIDPSVCRYLLSFNLGAIARTRVTGSTSAVSTNPCAVTVTVSVTSGRYGKDTTWLVNCEGC